MNNEKTPVAMPSPYSSFRNMAIPPEDGIEFESFT